METTSMESATLNAQDNNVGLGARIDAYVFDKPAVDLTFSQRLARENGWEHAFALRVIEEYRRFVYLACVGGREVTPSDEVDQVWHLHLAYTRDYWLDFCPNVLGRPFHHGPTEGGDDEDERYQTNYIETIALYGRTFAAPPPIDIWPPVGIRFDMSGGVRVNRAFFKIAPRPERTRTTGYESTILIVMIVVFVAFLGLSDFILPGKFDVVEFGAALLGTLLVFVAISAYAARLRPAMTADAPVFTQKQHGHLVAFSIAGGAATIADFEAPNAYWTVEVSVPPQPVGNVSASNSGGGGCGGSSCGGGCGGGCG